MEFPSSEGQTDLDTLSPPERPDLVRVTSTLSDMRDAEATIEDEGKNVSDAQGSFTCQTHGDLKFKFNRAGWGSSRVILKWKLGGVTHSMFGTPGKQTISQSVNTEQLTRFLSKVALIGPLGYYLTKKKTDAPKDNNEADNDIEADNDNESEKQIILDVFFEKTCEIPCFPGLEVQWSFEVENQRQVDYTAQFNVNRVKALQHSKMVIRKQADRINFIKHNMVGKNAEEKARLQKEIEALMSNREQLEKDYQKDLAELQKQVFAAKEKVQDLDLMLVAADARNDKLEKEMIRMTEEQQSLRDQLEELKTECNQFKNNYYEEHELLLGKEADLENERKQVMVLKGRLQTRQERLDQARSQFNEYSEKVKCERERFAKQEANLDKLKDECKRLETLLKESRADAEAKTNQTIKDGKQIKQLQGEVLSQKDEVLKKDMQIADIRKEHLDLADELDNQRKINTSTTSELQAIQDKAQKMKLDYLNQVEKLEERNALLQEKIEQNKTFLEKEKSDQQSLYQSVVLQLEKEKTQQATLHNKNKLLQDENTELRRNLEIQTSSLQNEREKLDKMTQDKSKVDAQVLEYKKEKMSKEREHALQVEALRGKILCLENERNKLSDQCRENGKEIALLKQENKTAKKLVRVSAETQMDIDKVFFNLKAKSHEVLQTVTNEANKNVMDLREQLARSKARNETSRALHNDTSAQLRQTKLQCASYKTQVTKLQKEMSSLIEQLRIVEFERNRKHRHLLSQKKIIEIMKKDYKLKQAKNNNKTEQVVTTVPELATQVDSTHELAPTGYLTYPDYPSTIEINAHDNHLGVNSKVPDQTRVNAFQHARRPHRAFAATDDHMSPATHAATVVPTVAAVDTVIAKTPVGIPVDFPYFEEMKILNEMGFWDQASLVRLLYKYEGDSHQVIQHLFS